MSITYPPEMLPTCEDSDGVVIVVCPVCNGEKQIGYLSSDNSKPPELGDCYRCNGTGSISSRLDNER